jgi:hypothetical protein
VDLSQLGPAGLGVRAKPLGQGGLGRLGDDGHALYIAAADTIKPWQYRSWLFIRDPDFAAKATRVLDLYARVFDGSPPGDDQYVISSDEKTSIQARCRTRAPAVARARLT